MFVCGCLGISLLVQESSRDVAIRVMDGVMSMDRSKES